MARLGVQPRGCFRSYPWHPDVHRSLGFQGNSELDGPVVHRQHKVGLVLVLWWLWCSFPYPFWVGVVQVRVRRLACADRVEGGTQPRYVALGLKQPRALLVELVDRDTTQESPT